MGRVSHAQAQANRQRVVERASQLFREQGTGVSVADLMKAAGLTHGGYYKQFASKEALMTRRSSTRSANWPSTTPPRSRSTRGTASRPSRP
jgi:AcrR family transcriptional regulator